MTLGGAKVLKKGKNGTQKALFYAKTKKIGQVMSVINPDLMREYSSRVGRRNDGNEEARPKRSSTKKSL